MSENTNTIVLDPESGLVKPLIATIRAAVNGQGKYAAYVTPYGVTRENVKHHALALAALAYPSDKPVQKVDGKRTRFGNAVQAAGNGLRAALDKGDPTQATTDYLAAVLKAAGKAVEHDVSPESVRAAVEEYLNSL